MRAISEIHHTSEIEQYLSGQTFEKADAFPVPTYRYLIEQIAKLSYLNKDHLLFFRGQGLDFRNRGGASTFYPTIYRGDYVTERELNERFDLLDNAARQLKNLFQSNRVQGEDELRWKVYIQWSILQHYEVCATPLLDLTHSTRVACSFAQLEAQNDNGFVYVFGLPYVMNRISHNSEHDLVNVRLLSICPPEALRPYFQEGYLVATEDIRNEYDSKTDLDFNRRLIAKFRIPKSVSFWGKGFSSIPKLVLYPKSDRVDRLCQSLHIDIRRGLLPGNLGEFMLLWSNVETWIQEMARAREPRMFSVREAINRIAKDSIIDQDIVSRLHSLRKLRNIVVHQAQRVSSDQLSEGIQNLQDLLKYISPNNGMQQT